jgi:hypothetical protein
MWIVFDDYLRGCEIAIYLEICFDIHPKCSLNFGGFILTAAGLENYVASLYKLSDAEFTVCFLFLSLPPCNCAVICIVLLFVMFLFLF